MAHQPTSNFQRSLFTLLRLGWSDPRGLQVPDYQFMPTLGSNSTALRTTSRSTPFGPVVKTLSYSSLAVDPVAYEAMVMASMISDPSW